MNKEKKKRKNITLFFSNSKNSSYSVFPSLYHSSSKLLPFTYTLLLSFFLLHISFSVFSLSVFTIHFLLPSEFLHPLFLITLFFPLYFFLFLSFFLLILFFCFHFSSFLSFILPTLFFSLYFSPFLSF